MLTSHHVRGISSPDELVLNAAVQTGENALFGPQYIGTKRAAQRSEILSCIHWRQEGVCPPPGTNVCVTAPPIR